MKIKFIVASILLASFITPTLAADEYYVVQDSKTKSCTIVEQKPTTTTTVVVGNGMYKTRTEAETAMKRVQICEH